MNEVPHPGFEKPGNYETLTTANQPEDIDRLTDIIYQQGIEKGKDEMRDALLAELGKMSIAVNSFTHNSANDFRAEGANKVIALFKEYIESL